MPAVVEKIKRDSLFQEISITYRQWPELERKIFALAHYRGQSPEVIALSLQLEVEEVSEILRQCDRRLQSSLSNFRKGGHEKRTLVSDKAPCPSVRGKDFFVPHTPAPKLTRIPDTAKIPA
ncbi:MAG: hypothetical protein JXA73_17965 [Acidobacteria bacterium]|nr:hypothetical protein [Acidobacteriota bacterium]